MLFHYLRQAAASLDLLENVLYFVSNKYKNRVYSNFFVNSLKWRREGNLEIWRFENLEILLQNEGEAIN